MICELMRDPLCPLCLPAWLFTGSWHVGSVHGPSDRLRAQCTACHTAAAGTRYEAESSPLAVV